MTGMNKNGRGAPGRHWKLGDRPVRRRSVTIDPHQDTRLHKRAKTRRRGFSDELDAELAFAAQARQYVGAGRTIEELQRDQEVEQRELKRSLSRSGSTIEGQSLLIDELVTLLRRKGVRLSKRDMEDLVRRRRQHDRQGTAVLSTSDSASSTPSMAENAPPKGPVAPGA